MSIHPSSKKRKVSSPAVEKTASKKAKHAASEANKESTKKGKNRETEFQVVQATLLLSISPVFTSNPRAGVNEMLDSMIMRYIPALQGVVLSHSNLTFLDDKAALKADCPFLVCRVSFDATIWSPRIGMKLEGRLSVCSPDHISILIHRTFNVSIPRHHIPDEWEFEYGPADNDPEFAADAQSEEEGSDGGRWVHKSTGEPMSSHPNFTVIGLTVANEMLSVVGSLQPNPFAESHTAWQKAQREIEDEDEDDVDDEVAAPSEADGLEESDEDADPFDALGKQPDVELAKESKKKRKAEPAEALTKKKKSKRKHQS